MWSKYLLQRSIQWICSCWPVPKSDRGNRAPRSRSWTYSLCSRTTVTACYTLCAGWGACQYKTIHTIGKCRCVIISCFACLVHEYKTLNTTEVPPPTTNAPWDLFWLKLQKPFSSDYTISLSTKLLSTILATKESHTSFQLPRESSISFQIF